MEKKAVKSKKTTAKTTKAKSAVKTAPKTETEAVKSVKKDAVALSAPIYNFKGQETGQINLPSDLFGLKWNGDLVHQVMTSLLSNARQTLADTKDRGEVRGGGKKPWRQKGTGRARHGSSRSPIWIGGGVTHGPIKERNYARKVNQKMKTKALFTVLSKKLQDGEVVLVDAVAFSAPKTKDAKAGLDNLAKIKGLEKINYRTGSRALIALPKKDELAEKSFRNIGSARAMDVRNLNLLDVLNYKYLVLANPNDGLAVLAGRKK